MYRYSSVPPDAAGAGVGVLEKVPIPCEASFDLKEVPDACPGKQWWGLYKLNPVAP